MEELVNKLDEIKNIINQNNLPYWLILIQIFVPILLSIVVLVITVFQHKQNKSIQNILCEKETTVQMHEEILKIYAACEDLCDFFALNKNLIKIFSIDRNFYEYTTKIEKYQIIISHANNHAKLIFEDKNVVEVVGNVYRQFFDFIKELSKYNESGKIAENKVNAWKYVEEKYTIKNGHFWELEKNNKALESFKKFWKDDEFLELEKKSRQMLDLFKDEEFDNYFAPYVKIGSCS